MSAFLDEFVRSPTVVSSFRLIVNTSTDISLGLRFTKRTDRRRKIWSLPDLIITIKIKINFN